MTLMATDLRYKTNYPNLLITMLAREVWKAI